ncbi:polysaccharide lyase family 7 protein [Polaribacter sp. KT 15]|uniref:polysaccharide lyase family 7 protein n=1 Tax=Polaribacter sp. KT 15 TaxID=1896175 RepID=UPI00090C2D16|nr:polysaccharide lyase family 7 protein [Polaribacter sp. KT 15]SHM98429.1 Putative binding domain-containing protein, N-terminal [Polaribacter sp. KT 15]
MRLLQNIFSFIFLTLILSCGSSETTEDIFIEKLTVNSLSEFSAQEETKSVNISSNIDWSVTANQNWISVTPTSSSNNGKIDVTVSENTTLNARTGTIQISGLSLSETIEVKQAARENVTKAPSENFDLSTWNLSIPENNGNGIATTITVSELNNKYQNNKYFYTSDDGGMVFKCPVDGFKTSANTSYTRVELREMLRGTDTSISTKGVNKNNWVFGTTPSADLNAAAGFDGEMKATLAINNVTTTGNSSHVGRLVIGQIHANDDEPVRIYYRKLKNNALGSIYFAHEPTDGNGSEQWYELIGSRSSSASNPTDGIALNEKFTYSIKVVGDNLTITISRDGKDDVSKTVDMVNSGYNVGGQYMYFKAGVYHLNNSGDATDFAQATFYNLDKSHTTK